MQKTTSTSNSPTGPAEKSNLTVPGYMVNAWDHVCPFCMNPPTMEEGKNSIGQKQYAFRCSNPDCPVLPETPFYVSPAEASKMWSDRVDRFERELEEENIVAADLSDMERYGMAKRFYIGAGVFPLSPSDE